MSDVILSLAAAPNGDVWVGTPDGLNRIRGNRVDCSSPRLMDCLTTSYGRSWSTPTSRFGSELGADLFIGAAPPDMHPILHSQTGMQMLTQANGLGSNTVGALARDANGDLWVATFAGLSRLHNGQITNFTTANGLSSNV